MQTLVEYLRKHVPLTRDIDIRAGEQTDTWLELSAPLSPNLNDKQTAFGGSLATLCTLAGWCVTSYLCRQQSSKVDIAVIDSHIRYHLPVTDDSLTARAYFPELQAQQTFLQALQQAGKAKLELSVEVKAAEKIAINFRALYYARLLP